MQKHNTEHRNEIYLYDKCIKKDVDMHMWFFFPGPEDFAMSSLGYLWLYKELDILSNIDVERVYSDSVTTKFVYENVDLIGVSMSFDMDFLHIFKFFETYNIEFKAADRSESTPLIYAGGPVITSNPEPYKEIFDFMVIGDGEGGLNEKIANIIIKGRDSELSKDKILDDLSKLEGVYVPKVSKNVVKRTMRLSKCVYTPILSNKAFFPNTFIIEVERGCSNRCGFCLASYINLPIRNAEYDEIISMMDNALRYTNKIALLGAQVTSHPRFVDICKYVENRIDNGENIQMSVSSLRVDAFIPEIVKVLVKAGQKNLTLAIEAGSERLRRVINKNVSEDQIFKAVETAKLCGLHGIKFYGMIGLPTETMQDIEEIIDLSKKIKSKFHGFDISFGFSTFVPKPHTPFQWFGRDDEKSLENKANYLKKELHKLGIQVSVSSAKWDYYQAVLSRGDSSLTDYLIEVYKLGGKIGAFRKAAKNLGINTDYYALEDYQYDKVLPWNFVSMSPGKDFLIEESKRLIGS